MLTKDSLTVGEKIKQIRKTLNVSQKSLAVDLCCSVSTISRIECGQIECNSHILKSIRQSLNIEGVPLLEGERFVFRERLYIWRDVIRDEAMDEADTMQKKLSVILHLPFEPDLVMMYKMFNIELLLTQKKTSLAKTALDLDEGIIHTMNSENLYHYYYNKGTLYMIYEKIEQSLAYFLKAYHLDVASLKKEVSLRFNIALCYTRLGMPYSSIMYQNEAYALFSDERTSLLGLRLGNNLAVNYIFVGELKEAEQLLNKYLIRAQNINNNRYIGIALHNLGCMYFKSSKLERALEYFNQAFEYFPKHDNVYLENIYYKMRCLIGLKSFSKCKELLLDTIEMTKAHKEYFVLFESLTHLMSLRDEQSCRYLKDVAIPHLVSTNKYFKALDYCDVLEKYFIKRNLAKKALEIIAIVRDVYKKMIYGTNTP
ncbi:MAG: helix-turn-helix transcriptional regulator [Defluviitaleaceae bacterium]|nr:helix-turn-helix transcriptional regulator [Defluviitaleaceae bacterium]